MVNEVIPLSFNSPRVLLQRLSWGISWGTRRCFQFSSSLIATEHLVGVAFTHSVLSILLESYCNLSITPGPALWPAYAHLSILLESYCNPVREWRGVMNRRTFNSPRVLLQRLIISISSRPFFSFQFSSSLIATLISNNTLSPSNKLSILLESYCNLEKLEDIVRLLDDFQFSSSLIATSAVDEAKDLLGIFQFSSSLIATLPRFLHNRRGLQLSILLESYCNKRPRCMGGGLRISFQFSSSLIATRVPLLSV